MSHVNTTRHTIHLNDITFDVHAFRRLDAENTVRLAVHNHTWCLLYGSRPTYAGASTNWKYIDFSTCPVVLFTHI